MSARPAFVREKRAKGRSYYYFANPIADERGRFELVRLPDIADPSFHGEVERLTAERPQTWKRANKRQPQPKLPFRPVAPTEPRIYFIGGDEGPIKIGYALRPQVRLRTLQIGSPFDLIILAEAPGGAEAERAYHVRFAQHRLRGEWFARHPDILAEIEAVNKRGVGKPTLFSGKPHTVGS